MSIGQNAAHGGRSWWAHFELTRINTTPTILLKKIEDVREVLLLRSRATSGSTRAARRAGSHAATVATVSSTATAAVTLLQ